MDSLQKNVEGYIKSYGYNLLDSKEGFLVADRLILGGEHDTWVLWVTPPSTKVENFKKLEQKLFDDFNKIIPLYSNSRYTIVAPSQEGYSSSFRAEIKRFGITFRVPIQFFDTPFKHEVAREPASIITSLADATNLPERVTQPYSVLLKDKVNEKVIEVREDLLPLLFNELKGDEMLSSRESCLRIIIGSAGIGKSVLFQHLFSKLYKYFIDQKNKQRVSLRPIPLIPDYFLEKSPLRTQFLINNFLQTDVASPVPPDTFKWMLINGFSMWLFDGLDELYAGDPNFFDYLLDLIIRKNSQAQILIFVRKSLLRTCEGFANLLEEYNVGPNEVIRIYQLSDWDYNSKKEFTWIQLEGTRPPKNKPDPPQVAKFLSSISKSESLRTLSSLPYYCDLLINEFQQGTLSEYTDDFTLVDHAISGIIEREKNKELLSLEDFEHEGLSDWLETIAFEFYSGESRGLNKKYVEEYAKIVLRSDLSADKKTNALTTLIQFPLFAPGVKPGTITFKHELVSEYLTGRYFLKRISTDLIWVGRYLVKKSDFADSLIARYMASQLVKQGENILIITNTLKTMSLPINAFSNLLQLLLLATPERDVISKNNILLNDKDLTSIIFKEKDLKNTSFRNCNLSNTTFNGCELQNALFEGAILLETRFENMHKEALKGAKFGNLNRFNSIYDDKQRIDDLSKMDNWIQEKTGIKEELLTPCPSALQLRAIFLKFIYPDGTARRNELSERALNRGKKYPEAPDSEACIKACCSFGYLEGPDQRKRYKRTNSDKYNDMINFVKDWGLSPQIKQLLNKLCTLKECEHIPMS